MVLSGNGEDFIYQHRVGILFFRISPGEGAMIYG